MKIANMYICSILEGKLVGGNIVYQPLRDHLQKLCNSSKKFKHIEVEGEFNGDEIIDDISFIKENDRSYVKEFVIIASYMDSDGYSDSVYFFLNTKGRLIRIKINENEHIGEEEI